MFQISAGLEWLFTEVGADFGDRVEAASKNGISLVEIWNWRDKDLDSIRRALERTGSSLRTMCVEPMGQLVDPSTHEAFLVGLRESLPVAVMLGSPYLVITAGEELPGVSRDAQHRAVVRALRLAADILEGSEVTLLLENLNSRVDHVGTYLDTTAEVLQVLDEVASPAVKMLYDAYHSLVMEEDPAEVLAGAIDHVRHVQIADAPGRGEPGSGSLDWHVQLRKLADLGYDGAIGLEYRPTVPTEQSIRLIQEIAAQV